MDFFSLDPLTVSADQDLIKVNSITLLILDICSPRRPTSC